MGWRLIRNRVLADGRITATEFREVLEYADDWAAGDGRDGISLGCALTILSGSDGIMSYGAVRNIDEARGRIAALDLSTTG